MQEGNIVERRQVDEELVRDLEALAQTAPLGGRGAFGVREPQALLEPDEFQLPPGRSGSRDASNLRRDW